ncbi:MAG: rRNA maturation RNase YbeY [Pseudomonadales bacterium]|jgi:probable rRNA maturation factor|nr:rRNA maturation RNase YbeY [Pseudomonadales bacterium]
MISVNFIVGSRFLLDRRLLRDRTRAFLKTHGLDNVTVDVHIVGARKIKQLNEQVVGHEGTTDVLSFPQYDPQEKKFVQPDNLPRHLGDVVIYYGEAIKIAKKRGKLVDEQLWFYLEHGLLHLLGYHHDDGM